MKKILLLSFLIISCHLVQGQKKYKKLWNQVEKLELEGKYSSASVIVDKILRKAKRSNKSDQIVKGFIYKSKFSLELEENIQKKIILDLEEAIKKYAFPTNALLESVYAGYLEQYLQSNRYKIKRRTPIKFPNISNDYEKWDAKTYIAQIDRHYRASLQEEEKLKKHSIKDFKVLLTHSNTSDKFRPTLYDFLAHRAVTFYGADKWYVKRGKDQFYINDPRVFGTTKSFISAPFFTKDSILSNREVLKLYQKLETFHKNKNNIAYIDVVLKRLQFSRANTTLKNKDQLYVDALKEFSKQEQGAPASFIDYHIAKYYYEMSQKANAKNDPVFKTYRIKALAICKEVVAKFPNSDAGLLCNILQNNIESPFVSIKTEKYVVPEKPYLANVTFKSIDSLYISAYKVPHHTLDNLKYYIKDSAVIDLVKTKKASITRFYKLQSKKNYYKYTTEIALPELPKGKYILVASSKKEAKTLTDLYSYSVVTASNLSFVSMNEGSKMMIKVLDKREGNSIKGAKVSVTGKGFSQNGITDVHGEFYISKDEKYHPNLNIIVSIKGDTLRDMRYYLSKFYQTTPKEDTDRNAKMFLYLDRSIYRPGQVLYFKGILIEKKKGKSQVVPNAYASVVISDVNNRELKEFRLKTNEYGAVSGEFKIPRNVVTGEFHITMDEDYGTDSKEEDPYYEKIDDLEVAETYFSVEEYKRPKFKVNFKEVTGNYVLGDSVQVSGSAKALLGAAISEAKVTYKITRSLVANSTRKYFYSANKTIKTGSLKTDAKGNFVIDFRAIPDSLIVQTHTPIFTYVITADVTDINGETRSASKNVLVGFHNLKLEVAIGEKLNQVNKQQLSVQAKNLNNQPISAEIEVFVYKLESPDRVLRKKPWNIVELPAMDKNTFVSIFPNEVYDSTDLKEHWKKGNLIFSKKLISKEQENINLENIEQWETGFYILEIKGRDVFKKEISVERRFEVFHPKRQHSGDHTLFTYKIINDQYKKDKFVAIKLQTACDTLYVHLNAFYKGNPIFDKAITIHKGQKIVNIPVKETYRDKIDFNVYYTKFNSFESYNFSATFPILENRLNIETLSFRNKLTPDQKETWSFKITGADQKNMQSEVLASMYDTSLDQFKNHSWDTSFKVGRESYGYYDTPSIDNRDFFRTTNFEPLRKNHRLYNPTKLVRKYHKLRWFGFDFGEKGYKNKVYLSKVKHSMKPPNVTMGNINGVVADESGGLPGVSVFIKGTTQGTSTDFDGFYTLNAPKNAELVFSYLGYKTESLLIKESGTYNVLLKEDGDVLDEVVVVGYATAKKKLLAKINHYGNAESISYDIETKLSVGLSSVEVVNVNDHSGINGFVQIRGVNSSKTQQSPMFIVDGVPVSLAEGIKLMPSDIDDISVLKGNKAVALYGAKASNGVVIITTKKGLEALTQVEARTNLKETAFFFPHLTTNKKGILTFSFNSPQALTKWKLMLFAHNKKAEAEGLHKFAVTQKEINVIPNSPRFLREKDTVVISVKVANLTKEQKTGTALLQLHDGITMQSITKKLVSVNPVKTFTISPKGNTVLNWKVQVPKGLQALQYKIVAKSGAHSDGESSILPVLFNRILITESKPLWVPAGKTQKIAFSKLKEAPSKTQQNHRVTLEYTSNPAWLAIKSLPYLMEFPHECAEQTFSRLYANTLASDILQKNPKIEAVFKSWKKEAKNSPLEENEDLKSILISETPWVRDAENDATAKARLALLFDKEKIEELQLLTLNKLRDLQMPSGGFPWFAGGRENAFITRHIVAGLGHLKKLNIKITNNFQIKTMLEKAIPYMDKEFVSEYDKGAPYRKTPTDVTLNHSVLHYLYARSFFSDSKPMSKRAKKIAEIYLEKGKESWMDLSLYSKGLFALVLYRKGEVQAAKKIVTALDEQAVHSEENGMYWKKNTNSWYWYRSPIETQALLIEAFAEIAKDTKKIDQLKQWLLKNKQTNRWSTTKATTEAIYALLMHGSNWLSVKDNTVITVGEKKIKTKKLSTVQKEAETGYMKLHWNKEEITPKMATIKVKNKSSVVGYGGVYWQYFEDLDKVSTSDTTPLQIKKSVFLKKQDDTGTRLEPIVKGTPINLGNMVTIRIEIIAKNDMEFVHLKDLRASGLEPVDVLSSYKWQDGLGYYQSTKDVATHFFFDNMPKGTYVFEYDVRANNSGDFSNGITTIQSMYAPEFSSHSKGIRLKIGSKE
jgi:TonB-dependent SusC/RagA subfamily outer membrane receptor